MERKKQLQPVAPVSRAVFDELRPGLNDPDAGTAAPFWRVDRLRGFPRVEPHARINEYHANPVRFAPQGQFHFIRVANSAMIVKIGDQFLDDNAQPREFVLAKPLCLTECSRRFGGLTDRSLAYKPAGNAVQIGFACAHRIRYVTLPKRLGGPPCFAFP